MEEEQTYEQALNSLIEKGFVELSGVAEDGDFIIKITERGLKAFNKAKANGQ